jgi:hypothetical protein
MMLSSKCIQPTTKCSENPPEWEKKSPGEWCGNNYLHQLQTPVAQGPLRNNRSCAFALSSSSAEGSWASEVVPSLQPSTTAPSQTPPPTQERKPGHDEQTLDTEACRRKGRMHLLGGHGTVQQFSRSLLGLPRLLGNRSRRRFTSVHQQS